MNASNRNLVLDVYMLLILLGLVLVGVVGSHVKPSTATSNIPFLKDQKAHHIQPSKNWMNDPNGYLVVNNALVAHPDRFHFLWKSTTPLIASTQYRTAYHFQPPKNWMNDPNGPMYYNGYYHLFYQYNPHSAVWGDIVWGHSVSTDLVNWVPLEPAIVPSESFDATGCWSGSATILPDNRPVILYTGADLKNRQVQNIAFPTNISDPLLREWTKPHYNPIIEPPFGIKPTNFRDPTTAWKGPDGHWRIAVGSTANNTGLALLYKSKDFTRWTKVAHPLHSTEAGGMWECPDFFPITNRSHVLKVSSGNCFGIANCDQYTIGTYLLERDVYVPNNGSREGPNALRLDYGKFYASKSFFDSKTKRRIVWGWSAELDDTANDVEKGWSGIQTIPRVLELDESGEQLVQWPIKELESLRRKQFSLQNLVLTFGETLEIKGINASQADIELEFQVPIGSMKATDEPFNSSWLLDPQNLCTQKGASVKGGFGPFGLLTLASKDTQEHTAVFFRVFKHQGNYVTFMCSDQSRSSLRSQVSKVAYGGFVNIDLEKTNGTISLRSLIDHSVVESFGGEGKICITSRVYPATLSGGHAYLYVFNNGTQTVTVTTLRAWEMATANIN